MLKCFTTETLIRLTAAILNFMMVARGIELDLTDADSVRTALDPTHEKFSENTLDLGSSFEQAQERVEIIAEDLFDMPLRDFMGLAKHALIFSRELDNRGIHIFGS